MELKYELELYGGNHGRLAKAAAEVEKAVAAYNAKVARTCTPEWERQLTPEGRKAWHEAALAEAVIPAEAAFDKEVDAAAEAITKARRMAKVEPRLADADRALASSEAVFAKEDVDHASTADEVIKLVEDAKLSGQRARLWCLLRYVSQRLHREDEELKEYMVRHEGRAPSIVRGIGNLELRKACEAAAEAFADPAQAELLEKAAALEKTIHEQRKRADVRRDEAAREEYARQLRARGGYGF